MYTVAYTYTSRSWYYVYMNYDSCISEQFHSCSVPSSYIVCLLHALIIHCTCVGDIMIVQFYIVIIASDSQFEYLLCLVFRETG